MNTLASVGKTVAILRKKQVPFAFIAYDQSYPTPDHLVRLHAMVETTAAIPRCCGQA